MLRFIKRWLPSSDKASKAPPSALEELRDWAARRSLVLRPVRDDEGIVIESPAGAAAAWRIEWGPAQRAYVPGYELRLRAELDFGADWQLLVLNRSLQEAMERAVFAQYVEGVQTRIDDETPPEMRWLVMFQKLSGSEMGVLRETFSACGNGKHLVQQWLEGPLTSALAAMPLAEKQPLVLMIGRGRLSLRTAMDDTDGPLLDAWRRLFETALREARRVAQAQLSQQPSTQPSLWSPSE